MAGRATIIVVSYNTRELLRDCLGTLRAYAATYPVIVVDNASTDGSAAMVEREFPHVQLLRNASNVGFGAASNRALTEVSTEFTFFLNSDTRLQNDVIVALMQVLDLDLAVAVVGCRLISPDGDTQRSARRFPSAWRSLRNALAWPDANPTSLSAVDYVDGAAMLARTDALREVAGFDERFFLYVEDADLCRRLRTRGWQVLYEPRVRVTHLGGGSTRRGSRADDRLRWEALAQYASNHFTPRAYAAFVCARAVELVRQAITGGARWVFLKNSVAHRQCCSALRYLAWHGEFLCRRRQ